MARVVQKVARVSLAGVLFGAASLSALAGRAGATEQDRITIGPGETIEKDYPGIPGQDPGGAFVDPDSCNSAPVVCDVIPITIKAPPSGEQEGFVRISISWEAEREPTGATSLATNDLDIYLWNDPPGDQTATSTPDDPDTDEDESEDNNPAASGNNPERLNLFVTEETEYLMVVSNFAGRNAGYTVEYRYFGADHAPPSVVGGLGAPAAPSGTTSSGDLVGSLVRPDGANPPAPFTPTPAALPALPEAAVESDGDFAAFDGLDLDEELAAPKDVAAFTRHVRDAARLGDPSAMALLAWLGLVPAALFGGLGFFLWRRRPVALRVAVSSGSR